MPNGQLRKYDRFGNAINPVTGLAYTEGRKGLSGYLDFLQDPMKENTPLELLLRSSVGSPVKQAPGEEGLMQRSLGMPESPAGGPESISKALGAPGLESLPTTTRRFGQGLTSAVGQGLSPLTEPFTGAGAIPQGGPFGGLPGGGPWRETAGQPGGSSPEQIIAQANAEIAQGQRTPQAVQEGEAMMASLGMPGAQGQPGSAGPAGGGRFNLGPFLSGQPPPAPGEIPGADFSKAVAALGEGPTAPEPADKWASLARVLSGAAAGAGAGLQTSARGGGVAQVLAGAGGGVGRPLREIQREETRKMELHRSRTEQHKARASMLEQNIAKATSDTDRANWSAKRQHELLAWEYEEKALKDKMGKVHKLGDRVFAIETVVTGKDGKETREMQVVDTAAAERSAKFQMEVTKLMLKGRVWMSGDKVIPTHAMAPGMGEAMMLTLERIWGDELYEYALGAQLGEQLGVSYTKLKQKAMLLGDDALAALDEALLKIALQQQGASTGRWAPLDVDGAFDAAEHAEELTRVREEFAAGKDTRERIGRYYSGAGQ